MSEVSEIESFEDFCNELIDGGMNYLYPRIYRTRSTDWVVEIRSHHEDEKSETLAIGQDQKLDDAINGCIRNFRQRRAVKERKAELLAMPDVLEALRLFGLEKYIKP